jgi:hypothetical protein
MKRKEQLHTIGVNTFLMIAEHQLGDGRELHI